MRISDWSSDVCSSDLSSPGRNAPGGIARGVVGIARSRGRRIAKGEAKVRPRTRRRRPSGQAVMIGEAIEREAEDELARARRPAERAFGHRHPLRSEEHTSELQSLMRISYAVFCLKKKTTYRTTKQTHHNTTQKLHKRID